MKVIKRDGSVQDFSHDKLSRWAEYAARNGADWKVVVELLIKRLPEISQSGDIHQTMVDVCLEQEDLTYSRMAARLQYAALRKNMRNKLGCDDRAPFGEIYHSMLAEDVWCLNILPEWDERFAQWYNELYQQRFEYWQIKQWMDKYSRRIDGLPVETPHAGALAIGLAIWGNDKRAFKLAQAIVDGTLNLPTPVLNGCRNGDFDTISCCVVTGGDTVDSIGVAEHIAYKMTAKKAGIGIEMDTRSIGSDVKNGAVKHLGKQPIFATVDKAVKMFTQVSRGGSATVTIKAIDPDIMALLQLKSQRTPENIRLDKLDYSFAYSDAFVEAVIKDGEWPLFDKKRYPMIHHDFHKTTYSEYEEYLDEAAEDDLPRIKARDILKLFLQSRMETGRVYCINLSRTNEHTPFTDTIKLSNLCQEICLPTKPYEGMADLYNSIESKGETAFCSLAAVNVSKLRDDHHHASVCSIALRTVDRLIDLAPMMTPSMEFHIRRRRSVGIGITGLAGYLYNQGLDFDGSKESLAAVAKVSEAHYYHLLNVSHILTREGAKPCEGIDTHWLPVDTMRNKEYVSYPWKTLRGLPRRNSVLVAHMPTESSAVFSDATNGVYPVRQRVVNKLSRAGNVQYIAPEGDYKLAWDIPNNTLADYYSILQDFTDQAISADYYIDFTKMKNGKISMSELIREWVYQAKRGVKTMYYQNTNDYTGGTVQDQLDEEGCESCKL